MILLKKSYFFTSLLLLPAFIFFFEKLRNVPVLSLLALPTRPMKPIIPWGKINWNITLKRSVTVILLLSLALSFFVSSAGFEQDFKNLRDTKKGKPSKRHTGVALTSNRKSSQPVVALADDPKTLVALHDTLLYRLGTEKDTLLRSFLTLSTFLPTDERQEERKEVIEEIEAHISARVFDRATGGDSSMIFKLRKLVEAEPFTSEDIPKWALRLVTERDNSFGKIGFIYGDFRSSDAGEAGKFQDRYGAFKLNGEDLKLFSSAFIYSDIIRLVKSDSRKMSWLISIIIILTLVLTLRKWKLILISVLCLAGGALWTVGIMGLLDVKLGPFNLIVVPTILGVSVDSIIHLLLAYRRYGKERISELFSTTGSLVMASVITTLAGYAGMLIVTHQGIQSIGKLAITGFIACLIIAMLATPWLCKMLKVEVTESNE